MKRITNIDSGFVCHCARIRHSELLEIFSEAADPSYEEFKRRYGIGGQCASCEYEVKAILDDYRGAHGLTQAEKPQPKESQPFSWNEWAKRMKKDIRAKISPCVNARACMFFINRPDLRSSLVISNASHPETGQNPNGESVHYTITVYDAEGILISQSKRLHLASDETCELEPWEFLPDPDREFVGSLYVNYYDLSATNSLRPYCILNQYGAGGKLKSRQHYHDKLYTGKIPGYVQSPSTFLSGRDCYLALVNCIPKSFDATLRLRMDGTIVTRTLSFKERQSYFLSIKEFFGFSDLPNFSSDNAYFWIESETYVMTYFFWHDLNSQVWFGQHH